MAKPKLVLIMSNFNYGGAEKQWAQYLANQPANLPFDIEIITFLPTSPNSLEHLYSNLGIPVTLIDRSKMSLSRFFISLLKTLWKIKPTIVHTMLTGSVDTWGRLAAWITRVPYIFHSELSLGLFGSSPKYRIFRFFLDKVTVRFLPNSQAMAKWLEHQGIPKNKIIYVPNPIDLDMFNSERKNSLRNTLDIPENASVAGFLATFRPVKRLDILLDALISLPPKNRPDYLILGGDGEMMSMVTSKLESDADLLSRTRLLGMVKDTPQFFASIDYLILTSDIEGLPNVVLEAMAMEKPIIASSVSDLPRLVEGTGFIAEVGNAKSFAECIKKMENISKDQKKEMGKLGRGKIEAEFEISVASKAFWQVHVDILEKSNLHK
jgi:glycosyltransferase involved in cell wall biosynthesis